MPIEITMPRLSDTMESGTVIKWNVKEGDAVSAGDVLADIETDKATMELQAYDDGAVAKILAKEGDTVDVGDAILILAEEGEDADAAASSSAKKSEKQGAEPKAKAKRDAGDDTQDDDSSPAKAATAVQDKPADTSDRPKQPASANGVADDESADRVFASPLARKLAEEKGVDLAAITGSGPSGRIVRKDVEAAATGAPKRKPDRAAPPAPAPALAAKLEARSVTLSNMRRTIAKRLVESKTTIPHYQVTVTVALDNLMTLREQLNAQLESQGVKLSVNDFLVRACALAMHQHPFVNSVWKGETVEILPDVNIGVAIAMPQDRGGGLVVATLRNADRMGLRQISADTKALAKKAREKGLSVEEMADSTFTISNLGMYAVEHFTAIINPPNTAILAVGAGVEKPVVRDGEITIGHEMQMTMSSDHRVIDGAMAAEYLNTVKQLLQNPATLLV